MTGKQQQQQQLGRGPPPKVDVNVQGQEHSVEIIHKINNLSNLSLMYQIANFIR